MTGAGGFVGGHVARTLAAAGRAVRGLSRRPPPVEPGDPPIEWLLGDLRDPATRARAVDGVGAVVHAASWVSLGRDGDGVGRAINVEATRGLLADARAAGARHFLYTSTLWTVAAGTADRPADEDSAWNLEAIRGPYSETKRQAERLILESDRPGFRTVALCPGLVIGPRDIRPTSTKLLLRMAGTRVALLPRGGIPVIDVAVLATAHLRALERAEGGRRYVVAGPYQSYPELAGLVARLTGRPRLIVRLSDATEVALRRLAHLLGGLPGRSEDLSVPTVAGGFLRLRVSGARADAAFGLVHPPPIESIRRALDDHRRSGRAPWLRLTPGLDGLTDGPGAGA